MKKKFVLLIGAILLFAFAGYAQNKEAPDFEKFKSQKIAFLTEKMNLSPKEAQDFWPVYNEFEKLRIELQQHRRELEQKTRDENVTLTDQEIIKTTRDIAATFKKEADLSTTYNEKFLKILPPQKVLQLYRAENQFRAHMFEQYRKKRQDENRN
jgi:hypothetical protein